MGTNFYIDHENGQHIGKRSAAGYYCWDCDVTLCAGGKDEIHKGRSPMLEACPRCGQPRIVPPDWTRSGSAAVELGFAHPNTRRPGGVTTASSFTWAVDPESLPLDALVVDEYGGFMSRLEFTIMLEANCPIQFTDMIGREFS